MFRGYFLITITFLIGRSLVANGIKCARCNSMTNDDCVMARNLPLVECTPDKHSCLVYQSSLENTSESPSDAMVVRDCSSIAVSACSTTGLRIPRVISCFMSCSYDGCNSNPIFHR